MSEPAIKTIVVGTDFNELATAALRTSMSIAQKTGARLVVVYADVFEPPAEFTAPEAKHYAAMIDRSKRLAAEELERYVFQLAPKGVRWKTVVAESAPAPAIIAAADRENADLIGMGTHGRGTLGRFMIGSVAEAVMRDVSVPVLTCRTTGAPGDIEAVLCPVFDDAGESEARSFAASIGADVTFMRLDRSESEHEQAKQIAAMEHGAAYQLIVAPWELRRLSREVRIPLITLPRATAIKANDREGVAAHVV